MTDWISDPNLSAEEKLARFEALGPAETRGPAMDPRVLLMPRAVQADPSLTFAVACDRLTVLETFAYQPVLPATSTTENLAAAR